MSLQSDIHLDVLKFSSDSISEKTKDFNNQVTKMVEASPRWWEVGAAKYRAMRWNGEMTFQKPVVLDSGKSFSIPSRDKGRAIPCRMFAPEHGQTKGVFMHFHAGGWVLQSEEYQDTFLKFIADEAQLTVVSVGYRHAPEDPYPAGPNDCYDGAEWLVDNAKNRLGVEVKFVGGESAGGHLSSLVCFHLMKTRPSFQFRGVVLHFGCYNLAGLLPHAHHLPNAPVLDKKNLDHFIEAFLPETSVTQRQDPLISPFYVDMNALAASSPNKTLPPALFTCGTEDPLLDDTVMMSAKWMMSGAETVVKIYPGAPHGYILFPPEYLESSEQSMQDMKTFLLGKLA